jgi:hypothetical protein
LARWPALLALLAWSGFRAVLGGSTERHCLLHVQGFQAGEATSHMLTWPLGCACAGRRLCCASSDPRLCLAGGTDVPGGRVHDSAGGGPPVLLGVGSRHWWRGRMHVGGPSCWLRHVRFLPDCMACAVVCILHPACPPDRNTHLGSSACCLILDSVAEHSDPDQQSVSLCHQHVSSLLVSTCVRPRSPSQSRLVRSLGGHPVHNL